MNVSKLLTSVKDYEKDLHDDIEEKIKHLYFTFIWMYKSDRRCRVIMLSSYDGKKLIEHASKATYDTVTIYGDYRCNGATKLKIYNTVDHKIVKSFMGDFFGEKTEPRVVNRKDNMVHLRSVSLNDRRLIPVSDDEDKETIEKCRELLKKEDIGELLWYEFVIPDSNYFEWFSYHMV